MSTNLAMPGVENISGISTLVQTFVDYYGEDRVDIDSERLIIHFPHVVITNNKQHKHIIKDLYAFLSLDRYQLYLTRATVSVDEFDQGYIHSHVNVYNKRLSLTDSNHRLLTGSRVCTGGGTPLDLLLRGIESDDNLSSIPYCLQLAQAIDVMVHWESLDGGPYIRMETLSKYSTTSKAITCQPSGRYNIGTKRIDLNLLATLVVKELILDLPVNYAKIFDNENIQIHSESQTLRIKSELNLDYLNLFIRNCLHKHGLENFLPWLLEIGDFNIPLALLKFPTDTSTPTLMGANEVPILHFKGKPIKFKIYESKMNANYALNAPLSLNSVFLKLIQTIFYKSINII